MTQERKFRSPQNAAEAEQMARKREEADYQEMVDRYSARLMNADLTKGEIKVILCQFSRENFTWADKIKSRISNALDQALRKATG
jgi:hypothetical protein